MTENSKRPGWRRALGATGVGAAMVAGLIMGAPAAQADILDDIGARYMQGASGGHISNYIEDSLRLRSQGFRPSQANMAALQEGWNFLPNQKKLVDALKSTVAYQRKLQAQSMATNPGSGPANKAPAWQPPRGDYDRNPWTPGWDQNPYG